MDPADEYPPSPRSGDAVALEEDGISHSLIPLSPAGGKAPAQISGQQIAQKKRIASEGFKDLLAADGRESLSKGGVWIIALVGAAFIFVGQWIVSHNDAAQDVATRVMQAMHDEAVAPGKPTVISYPLITTSNARFWGDLLIKVGELCLISFFLEFLLHSDHYREFFLDLVEKAVTGDRIVTRLGSSKYLWQRVSQLYFRTLYPKIHDLIGATLYDYFPVDTPYYLDEYDARYRICGLPNGYIALNQRIDYTLTPVRPEEEVKFKFGITVYRKGKDDAQTKAKIAAVMVGATNLLDRARFEEKEVDGKSALKLELEHSLKGAKEYRVYIELDAEWNIEFDPYETFRVVSLVNNLKVSVECDEKVEVDWCDLGVQRTFQNLIPGGLTKRRLDKQYLGLVFKNQGYRFAIRKAENHV